jgi:hypothetical protein
MWGAGVFGCAVGTSAAVTQPCAVSNPGNRVASVPAAYELFLLLGKHAYAESTLVLRCMLGL